MITATQSPARARRAAATFAALLTLVLLAAVHWSGHSAPRLMEWSKDMKIWGINDMKIWGINGDDDKIQLSADTAGKYLSTYMQLHLANPRPEPKDVPLTPRAKDATKPRGPRRPMALAVSGGGFRTMTAGIAYGRALSHAFKDDTVGMDWRDFTHLSGNSGGQWFATQFSFGGKFFQDITQSGADGRFRPLKDFFSEWGRAYAQGILFGPKTTVNIYNACRGRGMTDIFAGFLRAVSNLLRAANLPAEDWHLFINNMMSGVIPGWRDIKYGAPRAGLPEAALIQQIAIPPDTWVGKDEDAQLVRLTLPEGVPPGATLPAVHVAKARSSREGFAGFFAPGLCDGLTLTKRPYTCDCSWKARFSCPGEERSGLMNRIFGKPAADDGSACFAYCCGGEDHAQEAANRTLRTRWPRPGDADVSEITAMSSAAAGAAASPTIVKAAFKSVFKDVLAASRSNPLVSGPREMLKVFSMLDKRASDAPTEEEFRWWAAGKSDDAFLEKHIGEFVDECMPLGLHHLAVDVTLNRTEASSPLPPSEERAWSPSYRGIDGVYVDNTALAMTVATMITDCLAGDETLDCADKTLDVVLVNDGNSDPAANGLGSFFSDTGTPVGTYHHSGGPKGLALVPSQMIFAEPYPKNVTNYFTPSAIAAIQKWLKNPSRLPADLISSAASGRLNEAVKGDIRRHRQKMERRGGDMDFSDNFSFAPPEEEEGLSLSDGQSVFAALEDASDNSDVVAAGWQGDPDAQPPPATKKKRGFFPWEKAEPVPPYNGSSLVSGTFTTIDNPQWGVRAGWKVNLLVFCLAYPQDPLLQSGVGFSNDPIILPALTAATFFDTLYEPIARGEVERATPHLTRWLHERSVERATNKRAERERTKEESAA